MLDSLDAHREVFTQYAYAGASDYMRRKRAQFEAERLNELDRAAA